MTKRTVRSYCGVSVRVYANTAMPANSGIHSHRHHPLGIMPGTARVADDKRFTRAPQEGLGASYVPGGRPGDRQRSRVWSRPMRIAYLMSRFPAVTETFILRELDGVHRS